MSKSILQIIYSCSVQKTAPKNTKYWRNENILKIDHDACKGCSPCKILTLAQNLKFKKTMWKSILQIISSCSVQETAQKNTKYSRNESSLKIGHHACKGYSPCKILTLAQKLKFQKTCQNAFYKSFTVVVCKKPLQKTLNNREMRAFWKSAIMHAKAIAHAKSSLWLKN